MVSTAKKPEVYLLHFDGKVAGHANHYLGYSPRGAEARLETHLSGQGAKLVKAAVGLGMVIVIARVWKYKNWKEAREQERHLKKMKNGPRYCPLCRGRVE